MKNIILLIAFSCASLAQADILDRIDECERKGGGACVFQLLRELAARSGGQSSVAENKCKCRSYERQVGSNCGLGEFLFDMTRDGRSIGGSGCYRTSDAAYVACIAKSNTEPACR